MNIGFFDSGLGGVAVLKKALDMGLSDNIYYLGDTKNTPYGTKEENFVKEVINDNIDYLVSLDCNPIVIACNTATSLCVNELREKYPQINFIGTEPAVKVAADAKNSKKILVLATTITAKQEKLHALIKELDIDSKVKILPADKLVLFAEDIDCKNKSKEVEEYITELLSNLDLHEFSHIVLGCTHFPLFRKEFANVIHTKDENLKIDIVDGAKGIAKNLINTINKLNNRDDYIKQNKSVTIITTSNKPEFIVRVNEILENEPIKTDIKLR